MTKLSVNVNKLATLRNARGKNSPDVLLMSQKILEFGAFGITVHPRPDSRHIRFQDVRDLSQLVSKFNKSKNQDREFNVEGYPTSEFIELVNEVCPDQVTLVPDPPTAITSNAGWTLHKNEVLLATVIEKMKPSGARISLFIDPLNFSVNDQVVLKRLTAQRIELYTEYYADSYAGPRQTEALEAYRKAADQILKCGRELNAGHDLNQQNLGLFVETIPQLKEVSIGHALFCEALMDGLQSTVGSYLKILK